MVEVTSGATRKLQLSTLICTLIHGSVFFHFRQFIFQLKLVNPSDSRFEHLVTQMKWRLQEGQGEAFYEIGVEDNGIFAGLTDEEMVASLETLDRMAKRY